MAFVIAAGIGGLVAGGGISAITSWLTGGSHDQIKGQVVTEKFIVNEDGTNTIINRFKVIKDSSTSLVKLPSTLPWEADVVLILVFSGMIIHLLGALWGFLSGRCHTLLARKHKKVKQDLDHANEIGKLKGDLHKEKEKRSVLEDIHAKHLTKMEQIKKHLEKLGHGAHVHLSAEAEKPTVVLRKKNIRPQTWFEDEKEPRLALTFTHEDAANTFQKKTPTLREYLDQAAAEDDDL